ncbi:MAG: hypothetical protein ACKOXO_05845 [Cyanobium sp.]
MNPLPDRVVITVMAATVALVFALVFWSVRLQPSPEPPMLWRQAPASLRSGGTTL